MRGMIEADETFIGGNPVKSRHTKEKGECSDLAVGASLAT